jgi:hypothetical protein
MVDLDDGLALALGRPVPAGGLVSGGGVCTDQGRASLSIAAVNHCGRHDQQSSIPTAFASDSATNLHSDNGIHSLFAASETESAAPMR